MPILVVIIALTALSNVINRLFSFLGKGFVFRVDSNSDADYSERGRTIIQNMRSKVKGGTAYATFLSFLVFIFSLKIKTIK